MTSRICSTSWSVSWATRRSSGIPTFAMISLAFLGPIPWIYCSAITTRLLVGMLTPAMRATVIHSCCRRARKTPGGRSSRSRFANDNATPSPFPGARYRSNSRFGCGLLWIHRRFVNLCWRFLLPEGARRPEAERVPAAGALALIFEGFPAGLPFAFAPWRALLAVLLSLPRREGRASDVAAAFAAPRPRALAGGFSGGAFLAGGFGAGDALAGAPRSRRSVGLATSRVVALSSAAPRTLPT